MMKYLLALALLIAISFLPAPAQAASPCYLRVSSARFSFTFYGSGTTPRTTYPYTSNILYVVCTPGTAYTVSFTTLYPGGDSHYSDPQAPSANDGQGHNLAYQLYTSSAQTTALTGSQAQVITGTASSTAANLPGDPINFGLVLYDLNLIPAGTYTDTITATLAYGGQISTLTIPVSVMLQDQCGIALNPSNPTGSTLNPTITASLGVVCTPGTSYQISFNNGTHAGKDTAYTADPLAPAVNAGGLSYVAYQITVNGQRLTGTNPGVVLGTAGPTSGISPGDVYSYTIQFMDGHLAPGSATGYTDQPIVKVSFN